jgi:hypothetical protein
MKPFWGDHKAGKHPPTDVTEAIGAAKAVDRLAAVHVAQVNSYLRFSIMEVGLF